MSAIIRQAGEISSATFSILERMSSQYPELKGAYARGTDGVDVDLVVAVLSNALRECRRALPSPPISEEGE